MYDLTTIARPYAKAIFEHALAVNQLSQWSDRLHILALSVTDEAAKQFIANPITTKEQHIDVVMAPFIGNEVEVMRQLVSLLANNERLMALPEIAVLFETLRAEQEKTLLVTVRTFSKLSEAQQEQLKQSLCKRLARAITLEVTLDKSLLGGAVVKAGDLVIDGSVREQLNKLSTGLAVS